MAEYINVTTLNLLAKQVLEQCEPLNNLIVCGEVSNFTRHYKSGHCYFTLKDENAAIKCVMFRDEARLLGFAPENGMLVLAYGRATLYERDGAFQLYCDYMRPFGAGAAQMAFDALKKKLSAEGLFDADHKRPLPPMPQCIGLVTSKTGAALQDVIHIITRRWPMVKLLLAPVSVQGLEAEKSIVDGIRRQHSLGVALTDAVVGDGDGRVAHPVGQFDDAAGVAEAVHAAGLGMQMQFHALLPLGGIIMAGHTLHLQYIIGQQDIVMLVLIVGIVAAHDEGLSLIHISEPTRRS